jgi:hypothetical protein
MALTARTKKNVRGREFSFERIVAHIRGPCARAGSIPTSGAMKIQGFGFAL